MQIRRLRHAFTTHDAPAPVIVEAMWDNRPTWDNRAKNPAPFDNRPTWDNWNKK
ncbi:MULTISPECIES: multiple cyclophane-containing RiPP AmcA [unclassified Streptomyces]|uniref:multiple cyclophane-containing RiPP AmcA n=1 Tax=unclassified Streptomyces TaxID=2593676 RepID=UPI002E2AC201|nr:multiple cyclophane-containing RiPP AmcA [Streptomyces sp. NBC_00223]